MGLTPGGGLPFWRLALVSSGALGFGLTDAVFVTFVVQSLLSGGASPLLALLSVSLGGLLSVFLAPLCAVLSTTVDRRTVVSFATLYIAALACVGLAFVFSPLAVPSATAKPVWRIAAGVGLSSVYRASVQSSPIVPTVMNAALVRGSSVDYPARRDISLSFFYIAYRLGFVAVAATIAMLPDRELASLFRIMLASAGLSLASLTVAVRAMPRELPDGMQAADGPPPQTMREAFREQLDVGLLKADRRLLTTYVELMFYGVAFGQVGAVTASFFNDIVFNLDPMAASGLKWSALSMLIGFGVNIVLDALLPLIVFRATARRLKMKAAWAGGAFVGAALFVGLYFVQASLAALLLFSGLAVTTSTHNLFSLLSAGALIEPKFRAITFGVRAAAMSTGVFLGALAGGMVAGKADGFRWIMVLSAAAVFLSGVAALFAGSVEKMKYAGVAANANPLISHVFGRRRDVEEELAKHGSDDV